MKTPKILPQQAREHHEPQEGQNPTPWFVIVLVTLLFTFGVVYIARTTIGNPPAWGEIGRAHV